MHKKPTRPSNDVTQQFNSGFVKIYSVTDSATPGLKPVEKLSSEGLMLRYEEMRLGIQRFYSGKQNQTQIERVIRCPFRSDVSSQDVAITEDNRQYRIDLVQLVDGVWPKSMDITLSKTEQVYEVSL